MRVIITLILMAILATALPYLGLQAQSQLAEVQTVMRFASLETYDVQTGDVKNYVESIGEIEANQITDLSFDSSGEVTAIYVTENQYVRQGDVLAILKNDTEVMAYDKAMLDLNRAQLALYDVQVVDEDEIAIAEAQLQSAWSSYNYTLNQTSADDIAAAELSYENDLDYANYVAGQRDQAPGGYFGEAYQQLSADAGAASFNAEISRLQVESLKAQQTTGRNSSWGSVITAQADLDVLLAGATDDQLQKAELDVQSAQMSVDRSTQDYLDTFLVAPFDGYISSLNIKVGQSVSENENIIELMDVSSYKLTIDIDEVDLGTVEVGMPVEVLLDAMPDLVLQAQLGSISNIANNDNGVITYQADVILNEISPLIRVGMTAQANIITENLTDVLTVPNQFLREDRTLGKVFINTVGEDGELIEHEVVLGLEGPENSEILSGIEAGTQIAITSTSASNFPARPF